MAPSNDKPEALPDNYSGPSWGIYDVPLEELEELPDLAIGQADSLKIESDSERVWLSRCTMADGEPWDNKVTVERRFGGSWIAVEAWEAK